MKQEQCSPTPYHTDEAVVAAYGDLLPGFMARARNAGFDYHLSEDLAQTTITAVLGRVDHIDDSPDALKRYAQTTYTSRRNDMLKEAWHRNVDRAFEPSAEGCYDVEPSAEDTCLEELQQRRVHNFFALLLDPEKALLSDAQRGLLGAYLQVGLWREACQLTGSSADHDAAKARGRRLTQVIAQLVRDGAIERPN